jgi:hypothetical protein
LLINHDVDDALFSDVLGCVTDNRKNDKVVVIIVTYGGHANVAFRMGRFLQTMYPKDIVAFVPSICKSNLRCRRLQLDEVWSFVYAKEKNVPGAKSAPANGGEHRHYITVIGMATVRTSLSLKA